MITMSLQMIFNGSAYGNYIGILVSNLFQHMTALYLKVVWPFFNVVIDIYSTLLLAFMWVLMP